MNDPLNVGPAPRRSSAADRFYRKVAPLLVVGLVVVGLALGISELHQADWWSGKPDERQRQALSTEVKLLKEQVAERDSQINSLKAHLDELKSSQREQLALSDRQRRRANRLRDELVSLQSRYGGSRTKIDELTRQLAQAARTIEQYDREFRQQHDRVIQLRDMVAKLQANSDEIERRLVGRASGMNLRPATTESASRSGDWDESGWRARYAGRRGAPRSVD